MAPIPSNPTSLENCQACDLMSAEVSTIHRTANFDEVLAFFIDRNVTVAPVTSERGVPIGVLSVTDLLIHVRACRNNRDFQATAETMMTPTVFAVPVGMPAKDVVRDMLRSNVHHLFVAGDDGEIRGVISTCDVLRRLQT